MIYRRDIALGRCETLYQREPKAQLKKFMGKGAESGGQGVGMLQLIGCDPCAALRRGARSAQGLVTGHWPFHMAEYMGMAAQQHKALGDESGRRKGSMSLTGGEGRVTAGQLPKGREKPALVSLMQQKAAITAQGKHCAPHHFTGLFGGFYRQFTGNPLLMARAESM